MEVFQKIQQYLNNPFYPSTTTNVHHSPEVCKDQPAKGGCWRQAIEGKQAPAQGELEIQDLENGDQDTADDETIQRPVRIH